MGYRFATTKELQELYERAKTMLSHCGQDIVQTRTANIKRRASDEEAGYDIYRCEEDMLYIGDAVAHVLVCCYETGGIRECYGSTAKSLLIKLRRIMVLEDLASV